jgi:hypothetical protein
VIPPGQLEALIHSEARLLSARFGEIARSSHSEEDVRHACNSLIDGFIEKAGLTIRARHEYGLAGGRIDSKYAGVIIEYKEPKAASRRAAGTGMAAAAAGRLIRQLESRFVDFEKHEGVDPARILGLGTDGHSMVFVRVTAAGAHIDGPHPTSEWLVERLLRALVSLGAAGKSFSATNLALDFGASAAVAHDGVRTFHDAISSSKSPKAQTFFRQWRILFGEICGYDVDSPNRRIALLAKNYGLPAGAKPAPLLFALHTYYAVFMKFLAAEIASSFSPLPLSPTRRAASATTSLGLRREMEELEAGGVWSSLGITNFLEGDLFAWYLAAWTNALADAVRAMLTVLDSYDRSTLSVDPADAQDLLKELYQ